VSGEAAGICSCPSGDDNPTCLSFLRGNFPLFLFWGFRFLASLVGDDEDERKCAKVSGMRKSKCLEVRHGKQLSYWLCVQKLCESLYQTLGTAKRRAQMPTMWWSEALERRQQVFTVPRKRKNSAVALQGLRIPFLRKKLYPNLALFFVLGSTRRFTS
jgi:hypothetical protein